MTINLNEAGSKFAVELQGRLDTATAPQLEEKLNSICGKAKELVLDLNGLEYVSSAGLRVILKAQKAVAAAAGSMKLTNVNEIVMEIFEITGFADILTIE